ncbi:MAG TPA: hypothetical protein VN959_00330 [Mycobacterium sp.]|nr:hypothetical protein [Mycobacterium sp.]
MLDALPDHVLAFVKPTAPVNAAVNAPSVESNHGLMMPRRNNTRAQDRAKRIETERELNNA